MRISGKSRNTRLGRYELLKIMKSTTGDVLLNSLANKLQREDLPIHQWYRFVLSYPPHLVRHYLNQFGLDESGLVLDPFCGTGTTLVECKKRAIRSVGFEALPLTHFASSTKTDWEGDGSTLLRHAREVASTARRHRRTFGRRNAPKIDATLLLKNSISQRPLEKSLALLSSINQHFDDDHSVYERYAKLALATTLVQDASNLHFGPEVGVRQMKDDAPVIEKWLERISQFSDDLDLVRSTQDISSSVFNVDARSVDKACLQPRSVNAVITSPPYPNEKDYTRITRLESVFLGYVRDKEQLREQKKQLVRSNTRGVYRKDEDHLALVQNDRVDELAQVIEAKRIELNKTSGFEKNYASVVRQYFGGMARHFQSLSNYLKPGAQLAYVVGDQASYFQIMIRTGELLARVAELQGYEHIRTDLFRTRIATATRAQLREEVVILRWPGD